MEVEADEKKLKANGAERLPDGRRATGLARPCVGDRVSQALNPHLLQLPPINKKFV